MWFRARGHEGCLCRALDGWCAHPRAPGPGRSAAALRFAAAFSVRQNPCASLVQYLRRTCEGLDDRRSCGGGRVCVSMPRGSGYDPRGTWAMRSAARRLLRAAATPQTREPLHHAALEGGCAASSPPAPSHSTLTPSPPVWPAAPSQWALEARLPLSRRLSGFAFRPSDRPCVSCMQDGPSWRLLRRRRAHHARRRRVLVASAPPSAGT